MGKTGRKMVDLAGERFGKLTVLSLAETRTSPNGVKRLVWLCRCECGRESLVYGNNLTSGCTRSCGCLRGHGGKE